MPIFIELPPLSLYVHLPWCVRKCPYCDFNSHPVKAAIPETRYVAALVQELDHYLPFVQDRPFKSIFFGGGTPSLFSAQAIENILVAVSQRVALAPNIEITLEANPGTIDQSRFQGFYQAGVNRLSLGIQSFQEDKLKKLGRIHGREEALRAISLAKKAGFVNVNLDLMYGLPQQSLTEALDDLQTALSCQPTHLSWYQLTLEPHTLFYHQPPPLPLEEVIWEMQGAGHLLLASSGFQQYEVSAYALPHKACVHNYHYWTYGDYLGIGAGAHSKITDKKTEKIMRFSQVKHPNDYLAVPQPETTMLSDADLIFEFMLNALRLTHGVPVSLFASRTGLPLARIEATLDKAKEKGLLRNEPARLCPTERGKQFLNNLVEMFLPN